MLGGSGDLVTTHNCNPIVIDVFEVTSIYIYIHAHNGQFRGTIGRTISPAISSH